MNAILSEVLVKLIIDCELHYNIVIFLHVTSVTFFRKKSKFSSTSAVIKKYEPTDATTNPSLILQASQKPQYDHLIKEALTYAKKLERYNCFSFNSGDDDKEDGDVMVLA